MEALRPILSPNQPHRKEPMTVPLMPDRGYRAIGRAWAVGLSGDLRPYSLAAPGAMNASVVGFITSMVTAAAITSRSPMCAGLIGASSMARTLMLETNPLLISDSLGNRPYAVAATPMRIRPMPAMKETSGVLPTRT